MKARYFDEVPPFTGKVYYNKYIPSSFLKSPEKLIQASRSKISNTQNDYKMAKFGIQRTNKMICILFSAVIFLGFGILSQNFLQRYSNSQISTNLKEESIQFDEIQFENFEKEIEKIYLEEKIEFEEEIHKQENFEEEIKKTEKFAEEISEKIDEYLTQKYKMELISDEELEMSLNEFKKCSDSAIIQKDIFSSYWKKINEKNAQINIKKEVIPDDYKEENVATKKKNNKVNENKKNISDDLVAMTAKNSIESLNFEIENKIKENENIETDLAQKNQELNSLTLSFTFNKQEKAIAEETIHKLQQKLINISREIELLRLKNRDQILISDISTILKQLGHEEIVQKNHELAEILIQKIFLLQKSIKSHPSEEKKQALIQNQLKFKEILTFIIKIKQKAFKMQKMQIEEKSEFSSVLKIRELEKVEYEHEIENIRQKIQKFELEIKSQEKNIREIKEEIDTKITLMVKNMEAMQKFSMEGEQKIRDLKEKLIHEEKNRREKNEMQVQEKFSKIAEKQEIFKEISILEEEYKEIEEKFLTKMNEFENDLTICLKKEINLGKLMKKDEKCLEKIRFDKNKVNTMEEEIYRKIREFKF